MKRTLAILLILMAPALYAEDAALVTRDNHCTDVNGYYNTNYMMVLGHTFRHNGTNPSIALRRSDGVTGGIIPVFVSRTGARAVQAEGIKIPAHSSEVVVPLLSSKYDLQPGGLVTFVIAGNPCAEPGAFCAGPLAPIETWELRSVCTNLLSNVFYTGPIWPTCSDDRAAYPTVAPCKSGGN